MAYLVDTASGALWGAWPTQAACREELAYLVDMVLSPWDGVHLVCTIATTI